MKKGKVKQIEESNMQPMVKFFGMKEIKAAPMSYFDFQKTIDRPTEKKEKDEPGYLVEYPDGYRSWSPAKAFEEAYVPNERLSGGMALHLIAKGYTARRAMWPQGFVMLRKGYDADKFMMPIMDEKQKKDDPTGVSFRFDDMLVRANVYADPLFREKTNVHFNPWTPAMEDILANDWFVLREK